MKANGICYGFTSCWLATWLVYCPPNNRRLLYLSEPFLATTTAASVPLPGGAKCSRAATAYGALAFLQLLALRSANRRLQLQFPGLDMHPTDLGPDAASGSGGAGGDGQHGPEDGGSTEEPDAGADSGSGDMYTPTPSEPADWMADSCQLRGQELRRAAAVVPEPATVKTAQEPVAVVAPAAAQQPVPATAAARPSRPSRVLLRFGRELSPGSEGKVVSGTCDGVDCVIKLLGPDRSGLAAYDREVAAYTALEGVQGVHVPELLACGEARWGVRFLVVRRVAGGQPLSCLPRPIPGAVAAAALRVLEAVQAACPGFVHGDVRLENMLVVVPPPGAAGSGGGGYGDGGGGRRSNEQATSAPPRCVLLDFGRSRLDGDAKQRQLERKQLRQLLRVVQV